ncbi:MAG: glycosyl hydrolase family 28 protein [Bacteroidaceae bacterium]|nr:glycosyl hydrolase family 28 protein [Bacteroidaceae bacterium]
MIRTILMMSAMLLSISLEAQMIAVYPVDKESLTKIHDFSVTASGLEVPVYQCQVNPRRKVQTASWCQFGTEKGETMEVVYHKGKIRSAVVRPASKGIKHEVLNDSTIRFRVPKVTMNRSYSLTVEVNGDREHNLHVFVDGPEPEVPTAPDPDSKDSILWETVSSHDVFVQHPRLIYFGPGIHKPKDLPSGEIKIPSNCTVYMAPGAIVRARLIVDHAENVRIIGRGVVLGALRGVEITYSKNVLIDGLTVINPQHYTVFGGQSEDITIRNLRSFSRHPWSDGIDLMCCRNVTVEDVFLRNNDDAFALYNHRWWYWGGSGNFHIRRATIFSDLARPFNIGCHGDDRAETGEVLRDAFIEDCDVLSADGSGICQINTGDQNRVENVHFKNIRIEDVIQTRLFNVQPIFSDKYNRCPGGDIRGVWFEDIFYNGDEARLQKSIFKNYDDTHTIGDIHFSNIRVNGKTVKFEDIK